MFTRPLRLLAALGIACLALVSHAAPTVIPGVTPHATGVDLGSATTDKIGFYGLTVPIVQPAAAGQAALTDSTSGSTANATLSAVTLTDSTTGAAGATLAAGTGVHTIAIPIQLASMTTAAADLVTSYVPGYKFKILGISFATTTLGTGASASQVLNLNINSTPTTGGVLTLTLAGTTPLGARTDATAVTAANTGTATDAISLKVAVSGTVFTAGAGVVLVKIQNMDTADAAASIAAKLATQNDNDAKIAVLVNALRAAGVNLNLWKGAP